MTAGALEALITAGWVQAQALLILIFSLVGMRLALNWTGSAMRRARVDAGDARAGAVAEPDVRPDLCVPRRIAGAGLIGPISGGTNG